MQLKSLLFSGFIFLSALLKAQTDFRPGYVVTLKGDTMYGEIDYRGDLLMGKICKFRSDKNDGIKEYCPDEIQAFRFINSKYYVSKQYKGKKEFFEFLIKGKVDIYYLRDDEGDHYFIDKENAPFTEIPYEEGIRYEDNLPYFYESKSYLGVLQYYMNDAPNFQKRIQMVEKPDHQSLIKLAEDYQNKVCKDEKCIIYERETPLIKIFLEPYFGIIKYVGEDKFMSEFGGLVYFWAPRSNEKLYFKTGIVYNKFTYEDGKTDIYKIPLQIQYLYPSKKLKPQFSFGFNFYAIKMDRYKNMTHSLCLNAGLHYEISKNIDLSAGFNSDYTSIIYIINNQNLKFGLISYSISLGLFIKL